MEKRIVVLGAGESGGGAAILADKLGFEVFVSDFGAIAEKYKKMLDEHKIPWEEKQHTEALILNAGEVIKSPGIPNEAPIVVKVTDAGIPVISEIEFAGRYTRAKMVCITGSNGKTTTTSLIYHIFREAGLNVGLAGNIGRSLALQVAEGDKDYYIVELSSFQLDNMYEFRANVAVIMNITPDHLDRYGYKMQNYIDAKFRILQNQQPDDAFVYWNDDPIIKEELPKYKHGRLYPFAEKRHEGAAAYSHEEKLIFTEPTPFNMELEELSLTGKHNLYNSMAAGISANVAGIRKETIRKALSSFTGVEHRLEKVAKVNGVEYINDSKATNVNSCWYALQRSAAHLYSLAPTTASCMTFSVDSEYRSLIHTPCRNAWHRPTRQQRAAKLYYSAPVAQVSIYSRATKKEADSSRSLYASCKVSRTLLTR